MMKARSGDTYIFGLSARNLELLRQGRPIKVDLKELGSVGHVIVFYGETEAKMLQDLKAAGIKFPEGT